MKAKRTSHHSRVRAAGILEVLIVIATLALLAILILGLSPGHGNARVRAQRIACANNLKQIGLAARTWSNDHGDLFPWSVPMSSNGVKEIAMSGDLAAIFRSMT